MATKTTHKTGKPETVSTSEQATGEEQTVSRWVPASWPGRIWADVKATSWRARRQLVPHALAGGVAGAGLAAHAFAAYGTIAPGQLALILAGLSLPATWWTARRVKKRKPKWTRRMLISGLFAAGWLATAPYGVGPEQAAVLITVEYALGARWWQHHRAGYPTPAVEEAEQGGQVLSRAEEIISDYTTYAAAKGAPLDGSALMNPVITRYTIAFDLRLDRGKQSISTLYGSLDKLATALDVKMQDLVPERHPDRNDAWARLQVITDSPIAGNVDFTGPRRDGGILRLGPYADGDGEVPYKLYTPDGMWSGVIIGGTGIGKSRVIENIVISAISGGDTVFWYLDPQNGASSPALAEHTDWFATLDNADDMREALLAIVDARGRENAALGITKFTPSPERPGLLAVIEECHAPFADQNKAVDWARISREGRKVGVSLLLASQYPGLETFGGKDVMRSSVMAGNAIVLRTLSNSTKGMIPGLEVDPKTLPDMPGYGYVLGTDPAIGRRAAPWRNRNTSDQAGPWLAAQTMPELDRLAATATQLRTTAYRDRHETTASAQDAAKAFVEALNRGELPETPSRRKTATSTPQQPAAAGGKVIQFPGPITPETISEAVSESQEQAMGGKPQLGDSHRAVLGAIASGITTPREIEAAVRLSYRRVHEILNDLLAAGHIVKAGRGRYQAAA